MNGQEYREYYRFDARFNSKIPMTRRQFERKIKSKYILPIWDSYYQEFDYDSYYDCRDSIVRIFYFRIKGKSDPRHSLAGETEDE